MGDVQEIPNTLNFTVGEVSRKLGDEDAARDKIQDNDRIKRRMEGYQEKITQATAKKIALDRLKQKEKVEVEMEAGLARINLLKIKRYFEAFPELASKIPKLSSKPSLQETNEIVAMIRDTLNCQNSLLAIFGYCDFAFQMLENVDKSRFPKPLRLDLHGLTEKFRSGAFPELRPLFQEINIEYPWLGCQSLMMRTLSTFVKIVFQMDYINRNQAAKKEQELEQENPIDIDDVKENSD